MSINPVIIMRIISLGHEYEGSSSSPNLGKRVFGDLRVETYGEEHQLQMFASIWFARKRQC